MFMVKITTFIDSLVKDICGIEQGNIGIGNEPFSYWQELIKLSVTYDIERHLGIGYRHHYHGVNRNLLISYKRAIGTPFEGGMPFGINPAILKGKIFTIVGEISAENEAKIEQALHGTDEETVVVFWNTDGKYRFLPLDANLLSKFTVIKISKIPKHGYMYPPEMAFEYIYVYANEENKKRLKSYIYDKKLTFTECLIHAEVVDAQRNLLYISGRKILQGHIDVAYDQMYKSIEIYHEKNNRNSSRKKVLYTFYHGGTFGWCLIHRLIIHKNDDAYLLLADDLDWSPGHLKYRETIKQFLNRGVFQGLYTYSIFLGNNCKTWKETDFEIEHGIDQQLKQQGCLLDTFDDIYSSTDNIDTMGIYFDIKKINFTWVEIAPDALCLRNENTIRRDYANKTGYRDSLLKHGTMYGKGQNQSYVIFPDSKSTNFPEDKIDYFDPNPLAIMLSRRDRGVILSSFKMQNMPKVAHIAWIFAQSGFWSGVMYGRVSAMRKKYANWLAYYYSIMQFMIDYFLPDGANPILKPHPSNVISEEVQQRYFTGVFSYNSLFTIPLLNILPKEQKPEYAVLLGSSAPKQLKDDVKKISCESVMYLSMFYHKYYIVLELLERLGVLYKNVGERFSVIDSKEFNFAYYSKELLPKDINTLVNNSYGNVSQECFVDYIIKQVCLEHHINEILSRDFVIYTDAWETEPISKLREISHQVHTGIIKISKKPIKPVEDILVPLQDEYIFFFSKDESYIEKLKAFSAVKVNRAMGIELHAEMISMEEYENNIK